MSFKEYVKKRFGITLPEHLRIEEKSRVRIYTQKVEEIEEENSEIEIVNKGINAGRKKGENYKPGTDFLQIFGFMATRNIVILDKEEAREFIERREVEIENNLYATDGYVIVFYNKKAIGCGILRGNKLESNIPKYRKIIIR